MPIVYILRFYLTILEQIDNVIFMDFAPCRGTAMEEPCQEAESEGPEAMVTNTSLACHCPLATRCRRTRS